VQANLTCQITNTFFFFFVWWHLFQRGRGGQSRLLSANKPTDDEKRKALLIGLLQSQTRPFVSLSKREEHVENVLCVRTFRRPFFWRGNAREDREGSLRRSRENSHSTRA
jgi:hypothetical protein